MPLAAVFGITVDELISARADVKTVGVSAEKSIFCEQCKRDPKEVDDEKNNGNKSDDENKKHNFLQKALSPYAVTHNRFTYILLFAYVLIALLSVLCTPLKYITYDDKAHKLSVFSLIFSVDTFTFVEYDHALSV